MNYNDLQSHTFSEATKLASKGEEFSHLVSILSPDYSLRLKVFVQQLPTNIANKTIYGKAVTKQLPKTTKKNRV